MGEVNLESAVQVVTIIGGIAALVLAALQAGETWLDIRDKLKKKRGRRK